jgi:hypothetical protein
MALSLCIGKSESEAECEKACASFEMQPHELIFHRFGLPEGKFPLFKRMEKYFEDTHYNSGEIKELIDEIKEIKTLFSGNDQLTKTLNEIMAACESAIDSKLNIWVFCD